MDHPRQRTRTRRIHRYLYCDGSRSFCTGSDMKSLLQDLVQPAGGVLVHLDWTAKSTSLTRLLARSTLYGCAWPPTE